MGLRICGQPNETGAYHAHVFNRDGHLYRVPLACLQAWTKTRGRTTIHRVHDYCPV